MPLPSWADLVTEFTLSILSGMNCLHVAAHFGLTSIVAYLVTHPRFAIVSKEEEEEGGRRRRGRRKRRRRRGWRRRGTIDQMMVVGLLTGYQLS